MKEGTIYLRDCCVYFYFARVLLDALSVPPLGQVLGDGLGHVGLMLASWALLGALLGIVHVFLSTFGALWRLLVDLGLGCWFIFVRISIFCANFNLFADICLHLERSRLLYENIEKTPEKQWFFNDFAKLEVQTI